MRTKINHSRTNTPKGFGQVRIIGGQFRRTMIAVPTFEGLRPSSDRVRETVFNWMAHQWGGVFEGKKILDAFAGSGAFGLECVSRGSRDVVFVDTFAPAVAAIKTTLTKWQTPADVRANDVSVVLGQLAKTATTFDWIILDPPFGKGWLAAIVPLATQLAHDGTWLYVEIEAGGDLSTLTQNGWEMIREGKTAQVYYGLYARP